MKGRGVIHLGSRFSAKETMVLHTVGLHVISEINTWGFPKIRGPHNKDYSILGSTLGFP